jgi:hypothetical protein
MLGYSPLLGSDLGDPLAIPYYPSPRGTERAIPLAMLVVGTSLIVAERRQCGPEVARQLGRRETEHSPYSCLSVAGLCDTRRAPSHDQSR